MLKKLPQHIATLGFVGFMPIAPGTWGTGAAAVLVYLLAYMLDMTTIRGDWLLISIFIPLFILGVYAAGKSEKLLGKTDSGHIVIDEVCGYLITMLFLPKTLPWLIAGFFVFRLFDVVKPAPVRQVEKAVHGGLGVMLDDVLAAVYSNICLQLFRLIY
ncbi:MAG: phosphatidylglycerophosphatase A [Nitrospirae bacterium]|nr:phosphatidylglycerophosphatase A [Nitrospirota bacterium]